MTVDQIITLARNQTGTSTTNITDSVMLSYANFAYHDLENAIADGVTEDYFRERFTADTVANQNEYTLQSNSATQEGIKKLKKIEVKRASTDDYHTVLSIGTTGNYERSDEYIRENLSEQNPFYEFRDGSVFLYPEPRNAVTDGLKVEAIVALIDLVTGGAESTIFPGHSELRQYHQVISLGMIPYILRHRYKQETNESIAATNTYEREKNKMIRQLNSKYAGAHYQSLPSLNKYY